MRGAKSFIFHILQIVARINPTCVGKSYVNEDVVIKDLESTPHAWGKELIKQTQTAHAYRKIKIF